VVHVRDYLADQKLVRPERAPLRPAVSVVLPTWRRYASGTLQRALDSVLTQSFRDLELIVVDDGSTDGSWGYLLQRQAQDPRLVLIRHERNSGLPAIRVNEGIELSRGRYLAFQFDDDEWMEGALETLVSRAESLSEPAVVYGDALFVFADGRPERRLPDRQVNLVTLFRENFIANSGVLVPRSFLEEFGLYDCHIGMRRLCDWDLWIRLIRHVPFVATGGLVTRVHVPADPSALRLTAPSDFRLVRFLMALPRDELLSLARWRDYEIDALCVAGAEIPRGLRRRLVEEQIRPYYERQRTLGSLDGKPPYLATEPPSGARILACLQHGLYPSSVLCFGRYDDQTRARRTYVRFEQLVDQLAPTWPAETDIALFVRALTDPVPDLARRAVAEGVASAYYLDDDFLRLHEYGPSFQDLAPGQPSYSNLVAALEQVDAVWATSPIIAESVRPHNPRIVPHNGAVPEAWLPNRLRPRGAGGRIRIAHTGTSYRVEEFGRIWEGLRQISREFSEEVEFEFWGVDVGRLPALEAPAAQFPFTLSYEAFTARLRRAGFDILLVPLLDQPRPRLAKSPSKYYEVAAAGAFGIFSDVPPYASLPHGLTCLKAPNTPEAWYEALREALRMTEERFDAMRRRLIEHVRLEFTETAQIDLHEAACRATEFHRRTRGDRHADGLPRALLLSAEEPRPCPEFQALLRRYSIEPVVAAGPGDIGGAPGLAGLEDLLARERPAVALASDVPPPTLWICRQRGVAVDGGLREVVVSPNDFARGLRRLLEDVAPDSVRRRRPVVAIREGGDGFPGARGILAELLPCGEPPEFRVWCPPERRRFLDRLLSRSVRWLDSGETIDLSDVDLLVAPVGEEALLARAAAEGVLMVAVSEPSGGFPLDGVSGIVCREPTAEAVAKAIRRALDLSADDRLALRTAAYRAARARAHPDAVANELLRRLNDALDEAHGTEKGPTS
jgi:glycosyltransferase involved in cell wall biosynthesis